MSTARARLAKAQAAVLHCRLAVARRGSPPLTDEERKIADLEGWILGIM
jgi:hypothetical protein